MAQISSAQRVRALVYPSWQSSNQQWLKENRKCSMKFSQIYIYEILKIKLKKTNNQQLNQAGFFKN
jgi:hypothetical protein